MRRAANSRPCSTDGPTGSAEAASRPPYRHADVMEIAGRPFGAWLLKWDLDTYETEDIGSEKTWNVVKNYRADAMRLVNP